MSDRVPIDTPADLETARGRAGGDASALQDPRPAVDQRAEQPLESRRIVVAEWLRGAVSAADWTVLERDHHGMARARPESAASRESPGVTGNGGEQDARGERRRHATQHRLRETGNAPLQQIIAGGETGRPGDLPGRSFWQGGAHRRVQRDHFALVDHPLWRGLVVARKTRSGEQYAGPIGADLPGERRDHLSDRVRADPRLGPLGAHDDGPIAP